MYTTLDLSMIFEALAECQSFCKTHAGFRCQYYSYRRSKSECYLFGDCQSMKYATGWATHSLGARSLPAPDPMGDTAEMSLIQGTGIRTHARRRTRSHARTHTRTYARLSSLSKG